MTAPTYVAAFRAYAWDADIAALAARFFAACPGARHVVLADESGGRLPIAGHAVVGHTGDTSDLGLLRFPPDKSLWYNVDYAWYYLRRVLPDHDIYVTCESDVAVNLAVGPMVDHVRRHGIGLMAHGIGPAAPDWDWYAGSRQVYDAPWRSLLCFSILSGQAIDALLAERRRLTAEVAGGRLKAWPFCEAFVPTTLRAAGLAFAEVGAFADTSRFAYRPRYDRADPAASRPGSLVHSVLGTRAFLASLIAEHDLRHYFQPSTHLFRTLRRYPLAAYAEPLAAALRGRRLFAEYQALVPLMRAGGLAPERSFPDLGSDDLALCKPALVSSNSRWSRAQDPRIEACGANGADLPEDYGFHTGQEDGPWWLVDLLGAFDLSEIAVVNRVRCPERFTNFLAETSPDGAAWTLRHLKLTPEPVSSDPDRPYRIPFPEPVRARYVRLRLVGPGMLHLRKVRIRGTPAPGAAPPQNPGHAPGIVPP